MCQRGTRGPSLLNRIRKVTNIMFKSFRVITAALLVAGAAAATDWQKYEIYAGYDFVRFHPNSDFIPNFNANGGNGQFVYNFSKWIGVAVDLGAVTKGTL